MMTDIDTPVVKAKRIHVVGDTGLVASVLDSAIKKRKHGTIDSFFAGNTIQRPMNNIKSEKSSLKTKARETVRDLHVCLTCVKDKAKKNKKVAIISGGNLHQMKRHYIRHHCNKGETCDFTSKADFQDIIPINHVSVPAEIRKLAMSNPKNVEQKGNARPAATSGIHAREKAVERPGGSILANMSSDHISKNTTNIVRVIHPINDDEPLFITSGQEERSTSNVNPWSVTPPPSNITSDIPSSSATPPGPPPIPILIKETRREKTGKGTLLQTGMQNFIQGSNQDIQTKMMGMIEKLSRKIDKLSHNQKAESRFSTASTSSSTSSEMGRCYHKMKERREIKNLPELVTSVEDIALYPLETVADLEEFNHEEPFCDAKHVFRYTEIWARTLTPARAAKTLAADYSSICTGKYIERALTAEYMIGKGEKLRKLTRRIVQHMVCSADGHFKALRMLGEEKQLKKRQCEATETLVKCAFTAVKSKVAGLHYENQVAFAFSVGAQVGNTGHSRKLFPDLVKGMLCVINEETCKQMTKCLPCTRLPPHYYLTLDKATAICPMIEGRRAATAVAAPEVYTPKADGGIAGGSAEDSAVQALNLLEKKYGKQVQRFMVGKWIS